MLYTVGDNESENFPAKYSYIDLVMLDDRRLHIIYTLRTYMHVCFTFCALYI